jgi:hypothetical protein
MSDFRSLDHTALSGRRIGSGATLGVPLFFLIKSHASASVATICMIVVMLPFFLLAMYEKNGQPLEKVAWNMIQVCLLRPKRRPYRTRNFYAVLERQDSLDKEVSRIVNKNAHKSRKKANRGGNRQGQGRG